VLIGGVYEARPEWTGGTSARPAVHEGSPEPSPNGGGSDEFNEPSDTEMAPKPPDVRSAPGEPGRFSLTT